MPIYNRRRLEEVVSIGGQTRRITRSFRSNFSRDAEENELGGMPHGINKRWDTKGLLAYKGSQQHGRPTGLCYNMLGDHISSIRLRHKGNLHGRVIRNHDFHESELYINGMRMD